jgi:cellulose synthase/poly-beta-1,6-N-acetylglucosamine synthase-like glycosyltransferase
MQSLGFIRIADFYPDKAIVKLLPEEVARQYLLVPLWLEREMMVVASTSQIDDFTRANIEKITRYPIKVLIATYIDVRNSLNRIYNKTTRPADTPDIWEILPLLGHINPAEAQNAQAELEVLSLNIPEQDSYETLYHLLQKYMSEDSISEAFGWKFNIPHITGGYSNPEPALELIIPKEFADQYQVIPLWWIQNSLYFGIKTPDDKNLQQVLNQVVGVKTYPVYCPPNLWDRLYRKIYLAYSPKESEKETDVVDSLLLKGIISDVDTIGVKAIKDQKNSTYKDVIVNLGIVSEKQWTKELATITGIDLYTSSSKSLLDEDTIAKVIPRSIVEKNKILPLELTDGTLTLGLVQPDHIIINAIGKITGLTIKPVLLTSQDYETLKSKIYRKSTLRSEFPNLEQILLGMGLLTQSELHEAILGAFPQYRFLNTGLLSDYDIAHALSIQTGIPSINFDHALIDENLTDIIPAHIAKKHLTIPLWQSERDVWVAIANPFDEVGLVAIEQTTGLQVFPLLAPKSVVASVIDRYYGEAYQKANTQVVQIINQLISNGFLTQKGALQALDRFNANEPLDIAIVASSKFSSIEIAKKLAELIKLPFTNLNLTEIDVNVIDPLGKLIQRTEVQEPVDLEAARKISLETAQRLTALPINQQGKQIVVAIADPIYEHAIKEIENETGLSISPIIAERKDIRAAIERTLGRKNFGTHLLLAGEITRAQLNDAIDLANRTGVRLGRALIIRRYITPQQLYKTLADQSKLPFMNLDNVEWDEDAVYKLDEPIARKYGMIPINKKTGKYVLAVTDPFDEAGIHLAKQQLGDDLQLFVTTDTDIENSLARFYTTDYISRSVSELLERSPDDSAYKVLNPTQKFLFITFLVLAVIWGIINFHSFIIVLNVFITIFYLSFSFYKFYLIYNAISQSLEIPVSQEDLAALDEKELPVYTILIPVYKEAEVLGDLLTAVIKLDYPQTKLDIKVLMEADDIETIQAFHDWDPPPYIHGIVIPYSEPKTKPKACNFGLIHARGEYVVILDAEDIPEPDQLKRVLVAFSKVSPEVVCIQAKLNYFNSRQNLLTRWFTVEYSMWFDLFLPGMAASKAPIPLGGTSNHFKREILIETGAWDPYNVTEDADLGIRIHKRGYRTAIVDTTTYEEATSHLNIWIRQRSRWIKGYLQTWLVHMRHPIKIIRENGYKAFFSFQFVVGGTFIAAILNPIYWVLTTVWFFFQWNFINQIFPGIIYHLGAICLFIGNFVFTYMNVVGAMRRGYHDLVKYALLSPIYWGFASIAGWKAFWQLLTKPHYWEKTKHGFAEKQENGLTNNEV